MSSIILKNLYKEDKKIPMLIRNNVVLYKMVVKPIFVLSVDSINIMPEETASFTITANDKWTITAPEEVVLSSYSGYGNTTITLTGNSECQGLISVTCDGVTKTISITVEKGYKSQYLTFKITKNGIIKWWASNNSSRKTISYSKNNGSTWTSVTSSSGSSGTSINVSNGETLIFKGNNSSYATDASNCSAFRYSTAGFEVEGNIMSMIYGDNFKNNTGLTGSYNFVRFFQNCKGLTSAENLVLPSTTLREGCYRSLFDTDTSLRKAPALPATTLAFGCYLNMFLRTIITTAPELPATRLADSCYQAMFYNCASLNYIKCLATDISASLCLQQWVQNVPSSGTFVKKSGVTYPTGNSGIPSGWTVQEV